MSYLIQKSSQNLKSPLKYHFYPFEAAQGRIKVPESLTGFSLLEESS